MEEWDFDTRTCSPDLKSLLELGSSQRDIVPLEEWKRVVGKGRKSKRKLWVGEGWTAPQQGASKMELSKCDGYILQSKGKG